MAKALVARTKLVSINPQRDAGNVIVGLNVTVRLSYLDEVQVERFTETVNFDAWAQLSPEQQANLTDIQQTIGGYVVATYGAPLP